MAHITIFGTGNMANAIGGVLAAGGSTVEYIGSDASADAAVNGEIVVLAVPYGAIAGIIENHGATFAGKTVVDITNPLNFETFDELVVPTGSSAAAEIQRSVPEAHVVKAFNTNFAATLASGKVGENITAVLVAGDNQAAKDALIAAVSAGNVRAIDAGLLKRAHELESIGFLQLTLAANEKISWVGGFTVVN